ncbi:PREDICTED: uncharacterized protein LOC100641922 [Amphimedon queenslandica]|nr:PREDICTED: uncharacterized protein LOC100641922 [Amphimedon queenslandica]|eukprot:XP_019849285.1 PREDICTED: uncharacterized protein LOC100641922 [Amphimedon queenslandica]
MFIFISQSNVIWGQECTKRFLEFPVVQLLGQEIGNNPPKGGKMDDKLKVLQEYQFNYSSTNITSLILGIDIREATGDRSLFPSVQLFRRNGNNNNQYPLVADSKRTIYYSTSNFSTSGVFEYPLNPPIPVMSGDLLAVSQPPHEESIIRVYYISGITANSQEFDYDDTHVNLNKSPITNELILVYPVTDGYCVNSANSINASIIRENALKLLKSKRSKNDRQYLYPDIVFSCNGSLTKWIYGGINRGNNPPNRLPELQIWRQLGPNNYNKIGSSLVNANTMIGTNLYEFIPQTPLQFQEGDIFGAYYPHEKESSINLYEQERFGPQNLRIDSNYPLTTITQALMPDNYNFPLVTVIISKATQSSVLTAITTNILTNYVTSSSSGIIQSTSTRLSSRSHVGSSTSSNVLFVSFTRSSLLTGFTTLSHSIPSKTNFHFTSSSSINHSISIINPSSSNTTSPSSTSIALLAVIVTVVLILFILVVVSIFIIIMLKRKNKVTQLSSNEGIKDENNSFPPIDNPVYQDTDKRKEVSSFHYETDCSFYAEAVIPEPNYEEPKFLKPAHQPNYEWGSIVPNMSQRDNTNTSRRIYAELEPSQYYNVGHEYDSTVMANNSFFVESVSFWLPGSDCSSIYEQLSRNKFRELTPGQIKVGDRLGSGQFGSVSKGVWESPTGPVDVAIKTLNNNTSEDEKVKFLQEAAIMGQFHHPNIVKLHGMVTVGEPMMIVLELIPHGDMRQYLHTLQPQPGELVASTVPGLLLSFCRQIASGMEYLSKKGFVHRDLAARNILIADKEVCKISDFGMSRDLQNEDYYLSSGGQIPIKWTAPEALHYKKYSSASDVWSYGVLLYEIWSLGHKPFHDITNQEAIRKIESGVRLSPPSGCPREVYKIMMQCWHPERDHRPTFAILVTSFCQSDSSLISLSPIDTQCHPQAGILGAPLEAGQDMFTDLQSMYL